MKNIIIQLGSILAAVGISLMAVGCGDKDKPEEGANEGSGKGSGKEESAGKKESSAGGGEAADLDSEIVGFWAPNQAEMEALIDKEAAADPGAAAMAPMIKGMLPSMSIEVTSGEIIAHVMGQQNKSSYTVKSSDAASGTLAIEVTEEDGTASEGSAQIAGDKLTLTKSGDQPGETLILDRITKEQFEQRKKAAPTDALNPLEDIVPPVPVPAESGEEEEEESE